MPVHDTIGGTKIWVPGLKETKKVAVQEEGKPAVVAEETKTVAPKKEAAVPDETSVSKEKKDAVK